MEAVIAAITKAQFQDSQAFYSENCGWLFSIKLVPHKWYLILESIRWHYSYPGKNQGVHIP